MDNILCKILDNILLVNFKTYKYTYLYWELLISLYDSSGDFVLFWLTYKFNKLVISKYNWKNLLNWKKLLVLLKKYELVFINLLKQLNKWLNKIWDELDFINIYDKEKLTYEDIEEILKFTFIDDYTFRRRAELDFTFEQKKILSIYHSDFECSKCSGPIEGFTNFPNFRDWLLDKKYFKKEKRKYIELFTYITDYESISIWWNKKINEILSNKKIINNYDLITINKTCISVIMWDDIKSVLKQNNIPLNKTLYTDQNIDSWYKAIINYLKNISFKKDRQKNNKIVFFWLNKNKNTFEIVNFLKNNFNIEVWNILIPNINKDDLKELFKYKFAVFFRWKELKIQKIFELYPIDNLISKVPYSLENNYIFLKKILEKFWENNKVFELDSIFMSYKDKYNYLFLKSKKYKIWFIIADFHIDKFLKDNFRWVDILEMLKDMWFNISFFIYNYKNNLTNLERFKSKFKDIDLIFSNKLLELDEFLSSDDISLYYSEVNNDKRILEKNKEIFSIWDLEYWIDWFFRNFQKLIKKCEKVDYYKNLYLN